QLFYNLGVVVEPGIPKGPLIISEVTNTSLRLTWQPPDDLGGGKLVCYIIEARKVANLDIIKNIEIVEPEQTSFIVPDLEMSALYVFRVYAENEAGMGEGLVFQKPVRISENIGKYNIVEINVKGCTLTK
ncbi:hypothetical protein Avbf_00047, partial [Armadillidium vulgare]